MIQPVNWDAVFAEASEEAGRRRLNAYDGAAYVTGYTLAVVTQTCEQLVDASNRQEATLNAIRAALGHRAATPPSSPPTPTGWYGPPPYVNEDRNHPEGDR